MKWTPEMDARLLEMRAAGAATVEILQVLGVEFGVWLSKQEIYNRAHFLKNPDLHIERKRQWYQAIPDKRRAYVRAWRAANPEKCREQSRRQNERQRLKRQLEKQIGGGLK